MNRRHITSNTKPAAFGWCAGAYAIEMSLIEPLSTSQPLPAGNDFDETKNPGALSA